MKKGKKVLSMLLAAALVFSTALVSVSAADSDVTASEADETVSTMSYSGGTGTEEDPYLISTTEDLEALATECNATSGFGKGVYFRQTANLTISGEWTPIGKSSSYPFYGVYDGGGYTITLDEMTTSNANAGIFGYVRGASGYTTSISNVNVAGSMTSTSSSTSTYVGALAGYIYGYSTSVRVTVENCSVSADVVTTGEKYAGGVIGDAYYADVAGCAYSGTLTTGRATSTTLYGAGGIAGYSATTSFDQCMFTGNIVTNDRYAGGIAGYASGSSDSISNCLSSGKISDSNTSATSSSYAVKIGGIVAYTASSFLGISGCVFTGTIEDNSGKTYVAAGAITTDYASTQNAACYTTVDMTAVETSGTLYQNETYLTVFSMEDVWNLNTIAGTADNSLVWALDDTEGQAVFADDESYFAVVRVTYVCSDGETYYVYTNVGGTADAPTGYEESAFGEFEPGKTAVTNDITVYESYETTLYYYMEQGSDTAYASQTVTFGGSFAPIEDPTKEYCSFAGWVRADGTAIAAGDTLNVTAAYATWTPTYDEDADAYMIANSDALIWFRDYVNAGNYSANAVLASDIDLESETEWTPIGGSSLTYGYTGTFDGDGHSVSFNITSGSNKALFNYIAAAGVVKNVTITGSIEGTTGLAGIAYYNYGTIDSCVNQADISASGTSYYAGGICAFLYGGTIINCGNTGSVSVNRTATSSGTTAVAGIAAVVYYYASGVNGGSAHIYNCYNWGTVYSYDAYTSSGYYAEAGGIAGFVSGSTSGSPLDMQNCYNAGSLSADGGYAQKIGGVVAYMSGSSTSYKASTLKNSYYSDSSLAAYNVANATYEAYVVSADNIAVYESAASLLADLNSNLPEGGTTWISDTGHDNLPAFASSDTCAHENAYVTASQAATCTEAGYDTYYCPDCEKEYTVQSEDPLGHEYVEEITTEATCTEEGVLTITCSRGDYEETETIPALGHEWDWDNAVSDGDYLTATCTRCDATKTKNTKCDEWDGSSAEIWTEGSGTETDPWQIESAANLAYLAAAVNSTSDGAYAGEYFELTVDIDLGGYDWTPIGVWASGYPYAFLGTFDGGYHTISGLYISSSSGYQGLFGLLGMSSATTTATIKNLIVQGNVTATYMAAGVAGSAANAAFINVGNEVNVTSTSTNYVGGIVGTVTSGASTLTFEGCYNKGTVTGVEKTVSSYAMATGGILGSSIISGMTITLTDCYNLGTVSGGASVGGLVGNVTSAGVSIDNCYNGLDAKVSAGGYTGSIAGYAYTNAGSASYYGADTADAAIGASSGTNLGTQTLYSDYDTLLTSLGDNFQTGASINSDYDGAPALAWETSAESEESDVRNGLYADEDGNLAYYADGVIDTSFTGLVQSDDGILYYVEEGYVGDYTGLVQSDDGTLYYVENGSVGDYTGMAKYDADGIWYYFVDGQADLEYSGMAKHPTNGQWYYFTDGQLDWSYTGLAKYTVNGCLYYFANGQLDWTYTGLAKYTNGCWYYVANGQLDWSYTGTVEYDGSTYYVTDGQLDWSFTGDVTMESGTYHFENGAIV